MSNEQSPAFAAELSVVLTDDDGMLRQLIRLLLEVAPGYLVVGEASDAEQCVTVVGALQPDVVLLDLGLPGVNGLDAIPLIRAASPASLVIVLSGHGKDRMAAQAAERGADGYLEKGNLVTDLIPTLTTAVAAGRAGRQHPPAFR